MGEENLLVRFEEHIVGLGLAPATIANYLADDQNFTTWLSESTLGRLLLVDASAEHVRHYCQSLRKQGRSTSTINRRLQAVDRVKTCMRDPQFHSDDFLDHRAIVRCKLCHTGC